MSPEEIELLLPAMLGADALPPDDFTFTATLKNEAGDGAEIEIRLSKERDFLHLLYPLADVPPPAAYGMVAGAMMSNLSCVQSGTPALFFDDKRSRLMARATYFLPAMGKHQVLEALEALLEFLHVARREISAGMEAAPT